MMKYLTPWDSHIMEKSAPSPNYLGLAEMSATNRMRSRMRMKTFTLTPTEAIAQVGGGDDGKKTESAEHKIKKDFISEVLVVGVPNNSGCSNQ